MVCYVNDMKVSHKNKEEVTKFIGYRKGIHGEEMPATRGKRHTYLGIDLDYGTPGEVIVLMDSYITEAIDEFPKEMMKSIKTPAGNHLFKVDDAYKKLYDRDKIIFHRLVANLLFLSKRARPDIHPKIAFLTTRVINPDEDDWKKLRRVFRYLDATINTVKLHLNAYDLNVFHCWMESSYSTHTDLKVNTGATISIGKGCVTSALKK